jgi:iron(III) transport system ATP-binding protein
VSLQPPTGGVSGAGVLDVMAPTGPHARPLVLDAPAARPAEPASIPPPTPTPPARVSVDRLTLRYGSRTALDQVSLSIAPGEILCLLGPSGSGKSTLLRLLAGLERPTAGRVALDGREVAGPHTFVEPEHRRIGMVFQDYALFPHLAVADNVAFGLRGLDRAEAGRRVDSLLSLVGLADRRDSYPHMLSGGERQRVALARALAPRPHVLLMDEPFSGLDSRRRDQVREETREILRATGTTTLLVTHDATEAMRFGDRIALLDNGQLVQVGRPDELYRAPAADLAARAFGDVNAFRATCLDGFLETPVGRFPAPGLCDEACAQVCVRPQHVRCSVAPAGTRARVVRATFLGDTTELTLTIDGQAAPLIARVAGTVPYAHDTPVYVTVSADDVLIIPERGRA